MTELRRGFAVWAPRPDRVRLDVDGTLHEMTRSDDGWWRADVDARTGARYGFVLDDDPTVLPDPRSAASTRRCPRALRAVAAGSRCLDRRRMGRRLDRGSGDLRTPHRHVHRRRHLRFGDREAGLPGRSRCRLRRTDARQRLWRHARLGLRRRALVRRARTVRRARRVWCGSSTPATDVASAC